MRDGGAESSHSGFKVKEARIIYRNAQFDAICAELLDGLRERRGILLLTGEAGVGKTVLLRCCISEASDLRCILLTNASLDFPDILNYLCACLELPGEPFGAEQQSRLLSEALAASARRNQIIALLIDDAHHLRPSVLRRLHEFVETPAIPAQRLQMVLSGLPELESRLLQPELKRLHASVTTRCRLDRLSDVDSAAFIHQQFASAQRGDGSIPSPAVVERIIQYCQGVPRSIAMLCDTVLLFVGLDLGSELTPALVDEAAKSCFLTDSFQPLAPPAADPEPHSLAFPDLGLSFDFDLEETLKTDATPAETAALDGEPLTAWVDEQTLAPQAHPAEPPAGAAPAPEASAPALREFLHLLADLAAKQERKATLDQSGLQGILDHYQRALRGGDPARTAQWEQRLLRLQEIRQPILVSLAALTRPCAEGEGMFCAVLINPSWWLYREIRLRLHSADLAFADDGQAPVVRLLDGRDAWPVFFSYRRLRDGAAALWLELELCDHRGEWSAYGNRQEIQLDLLERAAGPRSTDVDGFWPDGTGEAAQGSRYTLPLELEEHPEQTHHLRAAHEQTLNRGTPLTRALLLAADPAQAPARIELVSRPFMIFGRQSAAAGAGFGDFTLGFVAKYSRISRLHCVVCALGDQLALMASSDHGHTYTGCNGQRLQRGRWVRLEAGDALEVCDLYRLHLTLAWDRQQQREALDWDLQEPRDRFGRYLLDLVEVLRQRDQQMDNNALRANLRNRYLHLLHMQDRVAELNGVGTPGALLYACFQRDDPASQQIVHYYVPKWLPIGSAPEDGLRLNAPDVQPHHAELLFRDGVYWLQNLGASGSVRVGCHGLSTNEVLALATGDALAIGAARFTFEGY